MGWLFGDANEKMFRSSFKNAPKISGDQAAADARAAHKADKAKAEKKKGKNKK